MRLEESARRVDVRALEEGASLSGHERNHLFLNTGDTGFEDVSGISGADHAGDARAFAWLDYDRDGWLDIVAMNANAPMLQLFRNTLGDHAAGAGNNTIAVRLVGGNHTARPHSAWTSRDGYGAVVDIDLGDRLLRREHRAGEGFAAQNSATLLIGIGAARGGDLRVRWPGGTVQESADRGSAEVGLSTIPAGSLVTVYENPDQSPTGEAFVIETYRLDLPSRDPPTEIAPRLLDVTLPSDTALADLNLFTTFATWCVPCLGELPELRQLDDAFDGTALAMYGVRYDLSEDRDRIEAWIEANNPPYKVLVDSPAVESERVKQTIIDILGIDAVPAALVTDATGKVLLARFGPPTISELRQLLRRPR